MSDKKDMYFLIFALLFGLLFSNLTLFSQETRIQWKRSEPVTRPELQLFHSPHAIDLSTATTLQKWDVEFEIAHRFIPTTGAGIRYFYGLDGPVNMRLALGLAPTDRMIITLGRSNYNDNIDLKLKYKFLQLPETAIPFLMALEVGGAWNSWPEYSEIRNRDKLNKRNFQGFGQLILNTMLHKKMGLGLVPAYLYNSDIRWGPETDDSEIKDIFRLGTYAQYYVSSFWSVLIEWAPYISGYKSLPGQTYNPLSFGIELETGGHFFKIFLTNSQYLNSSQYLAGADICASRNDWRIGFVITRLLRFGKKWK
jgi:hypothetical protein